MMFMIPIAATHKAIPATAPISSFSVDPSRSAVASSCVAVQYWNASTSSCRRASTDLISASAPATWSAFVARTLRRLTSVPPVTRLWKVVRG